MNKIVSTSKRTVNNHFLSLRTCVVQTFTIDAVSSMFACLLCLTWKSRKK